MKRGSGILLHITSLPSVFVNGSLGKAAYEFIDRLREAGQRYWQVLPCGGAAGGDPYEAESAFAGNPCLIDFELLAEEGLLSEGDVGCMRAKNPRRADFSAQAGHGRALLMKAYQNGAAAYSQEFTDFKYKNAFWLFDYALFSVVREQFKDKPPEQWGKGIAAREPAAVIRMTERHEREIECVQFAQFLFDKQWKKMKEYANLNGVRLIGELPFYLSRHCVERWADPELFAPRLTAGRPPGPENPRGEDWGYPLYDWNNHGLHGYSWWVSRVRHALRYCDILRIDRLRETDAYYAIPEGGRPADGHWEAGPGRELCDALRHWLGNAPILAGDTDLPAPVFFDSVEYCGFPRARVLQQAFGERDSAHLPHNCERNSVVYTAAPRGNTTNGWFVALGGAEKTRLKQYFGPCGQASVNEKLMRAALGSVADICILPMQDALSLPAEAGMFRGEKDDWTWRMAQTAFGAENMEALLTLTKVYGR